MKKIMAVVMAVIFCMTMTMAVSASDETEQVIWAQTGWTGHGTGIFVDNTYYENTYLPFRTFFAVSDKNLYDITIEATEECINENLVPGENILTAEQISNFGLKITAVNKQTGAIRVMNQSTVEGITILLYENGWIHNILIRGRAQISGAKLDRYTCDVEITYCS